MVESKEKGGKMLDCLLKNGTVIDGTGGSRHKADVGIRNGRIVFIGKASEPAVRTIDATGLVIAPGFIDIHTHYDAQVFWDGALTPSPLHGVTSVVGGNCGFSVAPLIAESADYLRRMLAKVEGIPLETLEMGVDWAWNSFGEYLDLMEGKLAINAGFLVGHSAIRRNTMGEAAVGGSASPAEIQDMARRLRESLEQGALGFSSSLAFTHNDGAGNPVPSRSASHEELLTLARELRHVPGTSLEFIPGLGVFPPEIRDLMAGMSLAANRPLNWNVLFVNGKQPDIHQAQLTVSDEAAEKGARVVALTPAQPLRIRINFASGFGLELVPGWKKILNLPLAERLVAFADPATREELSGGEAGGMFRRMAEWHNFIVDNTYAPENKDFCGKTIGEIAEAQGKDPLDTMIDISLTDGLRTSFLQPTRGDDEETWKMRGEVWQDERTVVGASDSGAHLDMLDTFTATTSLLGPGVRERKLISLEEAVRQLTDVPASLYGIKDRGRIAKGFHADLVVFDPERIDPGPVVYKEDLPGGACRLYAQGQGIEHVLVEGTDVVRSGTLTDARPGTVLRAGRDTTSVEVPGGASS